ncbi:cobalamin (vitamin B12) biosynthesis protein CbiG [Candidatus Nitrosopumilus koreensis AR1]|uniref:Cobalamin (Vitamin B12) biosynthesis protein CbiG n=1 Tax=Candidatus Nitrosopumilus koreensis AR1 TaxID=1229908 RepID=K0B4B1_9ARCH|nr:MULTISPECIES: cobalamin biosynthesis protein [Nitrosopumilus]AFS79957.1 cobalamin (vitamin B12) biosynthesis protein CbiG [Candidatus Nitrosopumilus koreensis AR1]
MEKISVLAITKNGINIGQNLKESFPEWTVFAPSKFANQNNSITWYSDSTSEKIVELFNSNDALICLFSLGAVIRLIAPHLKDKKTDPAVIVIDDKTNFVISVLSGHIGGANELTEKIAQKLQAQPVITTAADVNKTIAVDLVGRDLGWKIDDDSNVTKISAHMVNEEPIGVFQEAGEKKWHKQLPKNVSLYNTIDELKNSKSKANLIISDKIIENDLASKSVIYRPPSLVVGVGLHWDTSKETIRDGIEDCLKKFELSSKSIAKLASIKKPQDVQGLIDVGKEMDIPVEYVNRDDLAKITAPNPSDTVKAFEGTASVSEAAAILVSNGKLIVEKQKFPPNLTIAIARIED